MAMRKKYRITTFSSVNAIGGEYLKTELMVPPMALTEAKVVILYSSHVKSSLTYDYCLSADRRGYVVSVNVIKIVLALRITFL